MCESLKSSIHPPPPSWTLTLLNPTPSIYINHLISRITFHYLWYQFQFCIFALFFFIYSLKYLHLSTSPNPLVLIFIISIYSLPIPWSLILSIFTLLIVLNDFYKTWWNQYFKIGKEKNKRRLWFIAYFKEFFVLRNKK